MSTDIAERQQLEELKDWWRTYGLNLAVALGLSITAVFGWRYWQAEQAQQAEAASALHSSMLVALRAGETQTAQETAARLLAEYQSTGYATFARLTLAGLAVADDDLYAAEGYLRQALDDNKDTALDHIIRLRLARVLIGQELLDEAEALLEAEEPAEFAPGYAELAADIKALQGQPDAARALYREAISTGRAEGLDVAVAELKLDNLGNPGPN